MVAFHRRRKEKLNIIQIILLDDATVDLRKNRNMFAFSRKPKGNISKKTYILGILITICYGCPNQTCNKFLGYAVLTKYDF